MNAAVDLIDCHGSRWRQTEPGVDLWWCERPTWAQNEQIKRVYVERRHGPVREVPSAPSGGGNEAASGGDAS